MFILNISFFWSCQDRYFFSRTLDLQYLRNNSHFLFLIVVSSGHARIDSFSSNYHSMNYSTILLNFNVSRLFHHSFCFKSSISDSPVFYFLNSHPWRSHWLSQRNKDFIFFNAILKISGIFSESILFVKSSLIFNTILSTVSETIPSVLP